jgi:hypothetical protein
VAGGDAVGTGDTTTRSISMTGKNTSGTASLAGCRPQAVICRVTSKTAPLSPRADIEHMLAGNQMTRGIMRAIAGAEPFGDYPVKYARRPWTICNRRHLRVY